MKIRIITAILLICLIPFAPRAQGRTEMIFAFRSFKSLWPIRMILVGEIRSKVKVAEVHEKDSPFKGYDARKDLVTVKVLNRKGLKVGQKLYVIDKDPFHKQFRNGLIVGEIRVRSILYNPFYGWVLTGTGILLRVRKGHFVARTLDTENLERAYAFKKKGDHFVNQGDVEHAIASYNAALEADQSLPEAHAALGRLYFELARTDGRELPIRALSEFELAWKNRVNFQYEYDQYDYYLNFMDALYYSYSVRKLEAVRSENLVKLLNRIIEIGDEALTMKVARPEILFHLCRVHYTRMMYYRGWRNKTERLYYDNSYKKAGNMFEELLKNALTDAESYRFAALYFYETYSRMPPGRRLEEQNRRANLKKRIIMYIEKYNLFLDQKSNTRDPEIDRIYRSLK